MKFIFFISLCSRQLIIHLPGLQQCSTLGGGSFYKKKTSLITVLLFRMWKVFIFLREN